jgi:hypothetical protein
MFSSQARRTAAIIAAQIAVVEANRSRVTNGEGYWAAILGV